MEDIVSPCTLSYTIDFKMMQCLIIRRKKKSLKMKRIGGNFSYMSSAWHNHKKNSSVFCLFVFIQLVSYFGHNYSIGKFLGQGLNPSHSCDYTMDAALLDP